MALVSGKEQRAKAAALHAHASGMAGEALGKLGISPNELKEMQQEFKGQLVLPGMPGYDADRQGNPLYPAYPKLIAYCKVFEDVRFCLQWAHAHKWEVTCRSGGHSTAGFSVNNGLVIDVSEMNYVVVDPILKQARVGAGANWGTVNSMLNTYRLHVPGGGCDTVGVAGFMQGGGYGFTSREYGINCDNVLQVTMMLADGRLVIANAYQNRDLFWAVRGGTGNNFGVLLEITYQLHDLYEVWGFALKWTIDQAPHALLMLQDDYVKAGVSRRLGYQTIFTNADNAPCVVMLGMFHGSRNEGFETIAPLQQTGAPDLIFDHTAPYAETNDALINLLPGVPESPGHTTYELKNSGYLAKRLSLADWECITQYFATMPNPYNIAGIEPYGGAINAFPVMDSAFIHREVYGDFFIDSFWQDGWSYNDGKQAREWLDGFKQVMQPYYNGHAYQNYPVRDMPNFRWAYWGEAFNTLLFVKNKYDPANFFRFEQSISPYPEAGGDGIKQSKAASLFTDPTIVYAPFSQTALT